MIMRRAAAVATIGVLLLAGCGEDPKEHAAVRATPQTVCSGEFAGKWVELQGYVGFPDRIKDERSGSIQLWLLIDPERDDDPAAGLTVPVGDLANHVEQPPDKYRQEDMKLHDDAKVVRSYGSKLTIKGKVSKPFDYEHYRCRLDNVMFT